jgi:DNA-binding MarR family transcriptional regulator
VKAAPIVKAAPVVKAARAMKAAPAVKSAPADPAAFRVLNEIGIIDQLARNRFERVLPQGLSIAQFSVLNHFVRLGGEPSLVALSRAFQVSKPAMGKLVHRLAEQGLLDVRADPDDARGKRVTISESGIAMRHACVAALAPEVVRLHDALDDGGFERLLPALQRLRQWLDTHR